MDSPGTERSTRPPSVTIRPVVGLVRADDPDVAGEPGGRCRPLFRRRKSTTLRSRQRALVQVTLCGVIGLAVAVVISDRAVAMALRYPRAMLRSA
jgi:hypothetical protein